MQDKYEWTIIYTDDKKEFIHLDHLKLSNPNANILLADISFNIKDKSYAWRNCDFLIRQWLKDNIDTINQDHNIAILEWDVLVTTKLPDIKINGLVIKHKKIPNIHTGWMWFKEIPSLEKYKQYAVGISPLAVMFMDKNCIENLIDKEFDNIYSKNLYCELRLPTVLNSRNIPINEHTMPNVSYLPVIYDNNKSIYHSIKYAI